MRRTTRHGDEGEPVFSADAQTIVQDALAHYEERIDQLFADEPMDKLSLKLLKRDEREPAVGCKTRH